LFESLLQQTVKDFEWLIIDDGSTDNTRGIIDEFKKQADFPIGYVYKENGGKHTALNVGIRQIDSELTFIVDSDDALTTDAIETILHYHMQYSKDEKLCGYAFLRQFPNGKINGKLFSLDEQIGSYIKMRINSGDIMADKAEVFFTRCLKEFPFPEYEGEKFLGEDIVWIRMARKYDMVHINKAIYVGDYQSDGLTKNRREHNIKSPIGCMHRAVEFMDKGIKFKYRIKGSLQYVIYGKFAGYNSKTLITRSSHRLLTVVSLIPGVLLYKMWR